MPELAELRLTSDYINEASDRVQYTNIEKNPVHKGKEIKSPFEVFKITSQSRGKELLLTMHDLKSPKKKNILMLMGMSGHFRLTHKGQEPKHAHLKFISEGDGLTLSFVDVRRFGKWKLNETWGINRGPDPTNEYEEFKDNICENINKVAFNRPIYEVLMNQKYFNGIGNYLRAEILYRLPELNPFTSAREALNIEPKIFSLCRDIPRQAYIKGGGQLKDWENPFKTDSSQFEKFMKCYGNPNMSRRKDKNGRMFWYDPKWNKLQYLNEN